MARNTETQLSKDYLQAPSRVCVRSCVLRADQDADVCLLTVVLR